MTVSELIQQLSELDPNLRVMVSGYEGGYDDCFGVTNPKEFALDVNTAWYYGSHEESEYLVGGQKAKDYYKVMGVVVF
jgi:hypothetical protein